MKQATETTVMRLSQVTANQDNPRDISPGKFDALINSILIFPRMLEIRPVVIDESLRALGGNMRTQALKAIEKMSDEEIADRIVSQPDYDEMGDQERVALLYRWSQWKEEPTVPVVYADMLTDEEKRQFIIKDNLSYGEWDWDRLANEFDSEKLRSWGMDVWSFKEPETGEEQPAAFTQDIKEESDYFNVTLSFPKEYEQRFNAYFHKGGKDAVVAFILETIGAEEEESDE